MGSFEDPSNGDALERNEMDDFRRNLVANKQMLLRNALVLTKNHDAAQNLVQEVYLKALQGRTGFQPGTNMGGWLNRILRNAFIDEINAYKLQQESATKAAARGDSVPTYANRDVESRIRLTEIFKIIENLTPNQREAFELVGVYGYSYDEAATMLNTNASTIKNRVNDARNNLKKWLGSHGDQVGRGKI